MRWFGYISTVAILLLPLCCKAQGLVYDTSECARINRLLTLRLVTQDETVIRQQKQINLLTEAITYGPKYYPELFYGSDEKRLRKDRNIFAGTTGMLLIALAVTLVVHQANK